jgi:hypothetical protein
VALSESKVSDFLGDCLASPSVLASTDIRGYAFLFGRKINAIGNLFWNIRFLRKSRATECPRFHNARDFQLRQSKLTFDKQSWLAGSRNLEERR